MGWMLGGLVTSPAAVAAVTAFSVAGAMPLADNPESLAPIVVKTGAVVSTMSTEDDCSVCCEEIVMQKYLRVITIEPD
jgi:hypothetical protein